MTTGAEGQRRPTVIFFARVRDPALLDILDFYAQDIEFLRVQGYRVQVETRLGGALRARGDAYYCWWWHLSFPVVLAARARRRPVVVTGASDFRVEPRSSVLKRALMVATTLASAALASGNIAISEFEAADLRRIPSRRVCVIHPSVDVDLTQSSASIRSTTPTAVIVVQLNPASLERKGVRIALGAAEVVRESVPDFVLHVVGRMSSGAEGELRDWLDGSRGAGIVFHGEVSTQEKWRLLGTAWFYLQPSRYEGFGLAVAEGMASGAVPVVTRAGSLPEVVGDAGVYVERSPAAVAEAVTSLIGDPARLRDLQERAIYRGAGFGRPQKSDQLMRALDRWGFPRGKSTVT